LSSAADWQVHRRFVTPAELLYFASECDARSEHLDQLGRRQEAAELAQLGLQLLGLAKRDKGAMLAVLYSPSTSAVRLVGELPKGGRELDGTRPVNCGPGCGCRRVTMQPTVREILLPHA